MVQELSAWGYTLIYDNDWGILLYGTPIDPDDGRDVLPVTKGVWLQRGLLQTVIQEMESLMSDRYTPCPTIRDCLNGPELGMPIFRKGEDEP